MVSTKIALIYTEFGYRTEVIFHNKNTFKLQRKNDTSTLAGILCEQGDSLFCVFF